MERCDREFKFQLTEYCSSISDNDWLALGNGKPNQLHFIYHGHKRKLRAGKDRQRRAGYTRAGSEPSHNTGSGLWTSGGAGGRVEFNTYAKPDGVTYSDSDSIAESDAFGTLYRNTSKYELC